VPGFGGPADGRPSRGWVILIIIIILPALAVRSAALGGGCRNHEVSTPLKKRVLIPAAELALAPLIFGWMVIRGLSQGIVTAAPDIGRYRRMRKM
jgi:hypothetical protein